ncbi:MAG: sigma-70 family RNA polymerase sigma factor [Alphaproteobacteria bacterium]|nr:sigma-70 family RNA polymerase sigma factor [Alphaproteobacteria bacterium]
MTTQDLYQTLGGELRRYFARHVADGATADDLVQETFLRIHRSASAVRDPERLVPWVWRVARSVRVDHHRRQRPSVSPEDAPPLAVDAPEPALEAMVASWLPTFVEALPEPYREAVRLSELEGLSQKEVAERLGMSASGARTRVQRGRRRLLALLEACCAVRWEGGQVVDVRRNDPCGC